VLLGGVAAWAVVLAGVAAVITHDRSRPRAELAAATDPPVVVLPVEQPDDLGSTPPVEPPPPDDVDQAPAAPEAPLPHENELAREVSGDVARALPPSEQPSEGGGPCATFGTAVRFHANVGEAMGAATRERKLLFVLHVSGNFEETGFT
jgi:hypothetical protein